MKTFTTFDAINDATGFANGEKFASHKAVREYFTVENMDAMFGAPHPTQSELDAMANLVIENLWHCEFYDFITVEDPDGTTRYAAISKGKIERFALSSFYGSFGRQYGHDEAGDWVEIKTGKGAAHMNKFAKSQESPKRFKKGDAIQACDEWDFFQHANAAAQGDMPKDFELNEVEIEGFTYWDGNNHKSVCTNQLDTMMNEHTVLDDEEMIALLHRAIENKEKISEGTGTKTYEYTEGETRIVIGESFWQGTWAEYMLEVNPEDRTPEYY